MPVISVITAVLAGKHQYLGEVHDSLCRQEMPHGWQWQWIVQEDGETGKPLARLPDDPRISPGKGRRGRASTARTTALSRAGGILVRALDADDLLPPGALMREITVLTEHPDIAWCVSPAIDLLPDGAMRPGPRDPQPGPLPPGFLAEGEREGLFQVVGGTMCAYTDLVKALGGWPAVGSEDVGLLLAAEAVSNGWMLAEPGLIYRRWPGSSTSHLDKRKPSAWEARRTVVLDRVEAIQAVGWQWSPQASLGTPAHLPAG